MKTNISIVTVCHKSDRILEDYVSTFLQYHKNDPIEFILVENSGDQKVERHAARLRRCGFPVKVVYTANDGFGTGCNRGADLAVGNILVFVNPDVQFQSNLAGLEKHLAYARWGTVKQLNNMGRVFSFDLLPEYHNVVTEGLKVYRHLHRFLRMIGRYVFPIGSFFAVDRALFQEVGGFDERFFLYYEEAELARRLHAAAGSPGFCDTMKVFHAGLGTQPSSEFAFEHEIRGLMTYCNVTAQHKIYSKRLRTLRFLSIWSTTAALRVSLMKKLR